MSLPFCLIAPVLLAPPKEVAPPEAPKGPSVSVTRSVTPGTWRLTLKGEFETPAEVWTMEASAEERVTVEPDGTVTIRVTPQETKLVLRTDTVTVPGGPAVTRRDARNGELISLTSEIPSVAAARAARLQTYVDPPTPMAPNETWKVERAEEKSLSLPSIARLYRYLGEETRDNVVLRKVRLDARETSGLAPASLEATIFITPSGEIVQWDGQWRSVPLDDSGRSADVKFTLSRAPLKE